jgi:hypothetical protein
MMSCGYLLIPALRAVRITWTGAGEDIVRGQQQGRGNSSYRT